MLLKILMNNGSCYETEKFEIVDELIIKLISIEKMDTNRI